MTSKCGKNKKVAHEAITKCVTEQTWNLFVSYKKETNYYMIKLFLFQYKNSKAGLCPLWRTRKKSHLLQMKQFHWLLYMLSAEKLER